MNKTLTPLGKLTHVINCCKILSDMLKDTNPKQEPDGADTFFPAKVLCLLSLDKDQCSHLYSHMEFIKLFRYENNFSGEDEYYLTSFSSAVEFIYNLSQKDLNLTVEQYDQLYQEAKLNI